MDSALGNKDIIGEFTLPIESIQQGYHNVPLKVPQLFGKFERMESSCLFVHVAIKSGRHNFTSAELGGSLPRDNSSEWSLSAISASPSIDSLAQIANAPADTFDLKRGSVSASSMASGDGVPANFLPELRRAEATSKDSKQEDAEFIKRRSMLKRVSSLFSSK